MFFHIGSSSATRLARKLELERAIETVRYALTERHGRDAPGAKPTDVRTLMSEMLMRQALFLDHMITELAGQATESLAGWPQASREYVALALRAQASCRASLVAVERADRAARSSSGASAEESQR